MSNDSRKLPSIAVVALVLAFLGAVLTEIGSARDPLLMVIALVPVCAGVGILFKRRWSAYGYSLYQLASIALMPMALNGIDNVQILKLLAGAWSLLGSGVCFLAGRSLAASGGKRGLAWPWLVLVAVETAPFIFFHAYVMPSGSMENTMIVGDHLLVQKFPRVKVRDGDIVVFHYPVDPAQTFIKRVIGMPGDHIRIASRAVYRNGSLLSEPYAVYKIPETDYSRDNFPLHLSDVPYSDNKQAVAAMGEMISKHISKGELIVPPGKYFVLGDNRDNSLDSRYWGLLDESDIVGKSVLIYYSPGHWDRLMKLL